MPGTLESDLRDLILHRRILVVVGSGVSIAATAGADAASWGGLLKLGVERCRDLNANLDEAWAKRLAAEIESPDLDDTLGAAEKVTRKLQGRQGAEAPEYGRWLAETVGALEIREAGLLHALRDLRLPLATTNYDGLLEKVTELQPVTWRDQSKMFEVLRGKSRPSFTCTGTGGSPTPWC